MIPYPFRTKQPPTGAKLGELLSDSKKPNRKKLQRPSFSNEPGCWIFDFVFQLGGKGTIDWLFMMNINTRYLFAMPAQHKSADEVRNALFALFDHLRKFPGQAVKSIIGDGEAAFQANSLKAIFDVVPGKKIWNSSPYTYHGKILDRVVRTIRDAIGYRILGKEGVQQIIDYYNNTYHLAIDCTPVEMMMNPEIEWQYIRYCEDKVTTVKEYQRSTGLRKYKAGNVLLIHLEKSKTSERFEKQRRYWNTLGIFLEYSNGNVRVLAMVRVPKTKDPRETVYVNVPQAIIVPIYFTKMVAESFDSMKQALIDTYKPSVTLRGWQRFIQV
jgi:hypothetical protein